jgi:FkbM family methyltransferase
MYISISECIKYNNNKPYKNILHIGSSWGQEIDSYHKNGVESIVWIEASKRFMAKLFDNTSKYPIKQKYINACVSNIQGEKVKFNISNNGESSSMLEFGTHSKLHPQVSFIATEELETHRMDRLCIDHKIDMSLIDFINIDVQGAELKVLKGFGKLLGLENIKAIYSEVNFEYVYKDCCLVQELDDYLNFYGFKRVVTLGEVPQWKDALYIRYKPAEFNND